ncbi:MAG TPA: heme exporter protein CcmD [Stellaceae bacterium]|nr:heme exporter protein CcmD [Stellaceae bacterium]
MAQFFAMGGYARFVWPAYGVAVIVLVGLLVHSVIFYRRAQRALDAEERR